MSIALLSTDDGEWRSHMGADGGNGRSEHNSWSSCKEHYLRSSDNRVRVFYIFVFHKTMSFRISDAVDTITFTHTQDVDRLGDIMIGINDIIGLSYFA